MKNLRFIAIAIVGASLLFTNCKKKEDPAPVKTTAELIKGTWQIKEGYSTNLDGSNLEKTSYDACLLDNDIYFLDQNVYKVNINAIKCWNNETDEIGTYNFYDNYTKVELVTGNDKDNVTNYEIVSISETELKLKIVDDTSIGYVIFKKK